MDLSKCDFHWREEESLKEMLGKNHANDPIEIGHDIAILSCGGAALLNIVQKGAALLLAHYIPAHRLSPEQLNTLLQLARLRYNRD